MVTFRVQLVHVDGTGVLEPGYSSVIICLHCTFTWDTQKFTSGNNFFTWHSVKAIVALTKLMRLNPCFGSFNFFLICQITFPGCLLS